MNRYRQNIDLQDLDLPSRLRTLREERHLSQADLGEKAGLTYRTVHDLELGKRTRVQEKTLLLLAQALGVGLDDLLGDQNGPPPAARPRIRFRTGWALVLILALAAAAVVNWAAARNARWTLEEGALTVRDGILGLTLWGIEDPPGVKSCTIAPWSDTVLLVALHDRTPLGGSLLALDRADGDTLWSFRPDLAAVRRAFGEDALAGGQMVASRVIACDLDGTGDPEVLALFYHTSNHPCILAWIDRYGGLQGQYASHGHLNDVLPVDLDGDGRQEVLASGTTNARVYEGAAVVLLDADHFRGATVDRLNHPDSTEPDSSRYRLVLPDFPEPYMRALGSRRLHARNPKVFAGESGAAHLSVEFGPDREMIGILHLDRRLRPQGTVLKDHFLERMPTLLPDSLTVGTGPADPVWRARWLAGHHRFGAGIRAPARSAP